jgi:hypothetical protein
MDDAVKRIANDPAQTTEKLGKEPFDHHARVLLGNKKTELARRHRGFGYFAKRSFVVAIELR